MIKRLAFSIVLVGLGAFVALGVYRRIMRAENPTSVQWEGAQRKTFGPCEDHRSGLAMAPAVAGLDPQVLAFSSDCRWIVAGNQNGSIQILDRESGRLRAEAPGFNLRVTHLLITADDKYVFASAQFSEEVQAWSLPDLARVATVPAYRGGSSALAFDTRTNLLFIGSSHDLKGWKIEPGGGIAIGAPVFAARTRAVIESLALSPDSQYLAAGEAGSIEVWKYESGERPGLTPVSAISPYEPKNWVMAMSFSADGKALVSANRKREIGVWQVPTLAPVSQAAADPARWELYEDPWRFTARPPRDYAGPDKRQLIVQLDNSTADRIYNASALLKSGDVYAWRGLVQANGNSGGISLFDIFEPSMPRTLAIPVPYRGTIGMLGFAPLRGSSWLAMKRRDAAISVIDVITLKEIRRVPAPPARASLQGTLNGRHLAYSTEEEIAFVDLETWETRKLPRPKWGSDTQRINLGLAASLDGTGVAAIFGDRLVEVRPDLSVKEVARLPMMGVEFMAPLRAKRAYLLSGTGGTKAFGNPAVALNVAAEASPMGGAALAADEQALYVAEISRARICRYALEAGSSCEVVASFEGPVPPLDTGGNLLVLGFHKQVRVMDAGGKEIAKLEGHTDLVSFVQVVGDRVVSVDRTGEVRTWSPGKPSSLLSAKLY
jgi:hypothetical protein